MLTEGRKILIHYIEMLMEANDINISNDNIIELKFIFDEIDNTIDDKLNEFATKYNLDREKKKWTSQKTKPTHNRTTNKTLGE